MVASIPIFFHFVVFLAANKGPSNSQPRRGPQQPQKAPPSASSLEAKNNDNPKSAKRGRQRYAPSVKNQEPQQTERANSRRYGEYSKPRVRNQQNGTRTTTKDEASAAEDFTVTLPPLTDNINGPFPTLFTCRHTYEDALMEEITRYAPNEVSATPLCPGLVHVEGLLLSISDDKQVENHHHRLRDPVYALQSMPDCRILECPDASIKQLARAIADMEAFTSQLAPAPRGSLSVHALVPGMCRGQKEPVPMQRRSQLVAQAVVEMWRKTFAAARKKPQPKTTEKDDDDNDVATTSTKNRRDENDDDDDDHSLLLQILLLSPDVAAVSLSRCQSVSYSSSSKRSDSSNTDWRWPNDQYAAGMALVDITTQKMPSSAYRKLLEACACWGLRPSGTVVDLGASPGGWTSALLLYCNDDNPPPPHEQQQRGATSRSNGIHIIAIDRSPLDPKLMKDPRVTFVQGDAFTYEPEEPVTWMVSDIIAYPERIVELLHDWCKTQKALYMIVTMKFQGTTPSWDHLEEALQVADSYNYVVRAKHFFNNKNEVTLMLRYKGQSETTTINSAATPIPPFYTPL